jgi:hypothetical protein
MGERVSTMRGLGHGSVDPDGTRRPAEAPTESDSRLAGGDVSKGLVDDQVGLDESFAILRMNIMVAANPKTIPTRIPIRLEPSL